MSTVLLDPAAIVPHVELSASQPTPSLAAEVSDVLPLLVRVTDLVVAELPKSSLSGETENVPDRARDLGSTSTGEELHAAAMDAHTTSIAAQCARMAWEYTWETPCVRYAMGQRRMKCYVSLP